MDLLEQYKQQNPEMFREENRPQATDEYGREYKGMVRLVMRLSGGRIRDTRRANMVLLGTAMVLTCITIAFFLLGSSGGIEQPSAELIQRSQSVEDFISR